MTEVFADTFYWLALLNIDDAHHEEVVQVPVPGRIATTWAIQLEVMDALSEQRFRPLAMNFWQQTNQDAGIVVVPLDATLLSRAVAFFAQRPDKNWSLTDCIPFVVMQDRGIAKALTKDRHFEQAGFQALFRTS